MSGLDLYQTQRALALLFVYAAAAGFLLGGWYSLLRFLRTFWEGRPSGEEQGSRRRSSALLLFLGDTVFAVTAALTLILLLYYGNDGQLRAPAAIGLACGCFVYHATLGRLTAKLEKPLSRFIKRTIRLALSLLLAPLLWVGSLTARCARLLWRATGGKALQKHREQQTKRTVQRLKASADRGFDLMPDPHATTPKK